MFETLPEQFREFGLKVDVRALLLLRKAMSRDLVKTIGDIFTVLRGIIVKNPDELGLYTKAFYRYFLAIDIQNGQRLNDAVLRSETFKKWRDDNTELIDSELDEDGLVNLFLDEIHLTTYDIKEIIDGRELWENDRGNVEDEDPDGLEGEASRRTLDKMADYSDLSLEELLERMNEVLKEQKSKHSGGSHWVGTGGISPYGHGGAAKDGLRVGGTGGGKMARKVLGDRKFFPVDLDANLNDNNVDAALAALKGIIEETSIEKLDIPDTINKGLQRGGLFFPELKNEQENKLQVLLLIDNGGYSMDAHIAAVQTLFRKMKTRFAHDLETYYFHNTLHGFVYSDPQRTKKIPIERILKKDPNYRVFFVGDAAMSPYEMSRESVQNYRDLQQHFTKIAWLNPEPLTYWNYTYTIQLIKELIDMYRLTPKGIEQAVQAMNRRK